MDSNSAQTFEDLHKMKMHETICFQSGSVHVQVLRVPHGWIYTQMDKSCGVMTSQFVPFINSIGVE